MQEQELEAMIQERGLNAPRLTPESIDSVIVNATYTMLPSGKVMVCEITLKNGFTVRGGSCVVSKDNFNLEIGKRVSFEKARDKIWDQIRYQIYTQILGRLYQPIKNRVYDEIR